MAWCKESQGRCMSHWCNVFMGKKMEKLVLRHDKVPAEVSLINYDDAMQIAPAAGSPECTAQLACHCGGRITHGLCEK